MQKEKEDKLQKTMERLIAALEPLQGNSTLRQVWLETQWLKSNLESGRRLLPDNWQLTIYQRPKELKDHLEVYRLANQLLEELDCYIFELDRKGK